ncbi:MAG: SulP family inorganic anion transporter [Rhodocyclaceae bacterium]|nr:SulP family inorganic anion transporter [Rhodocyclaceae bacterium]
MNLPLKTLLPFLRWLPLHGSTLRTDFIAGLTVALVLVPQSMAYAQLAGLPAYYGLYAAFLPVMVAALWGSSNQLGTGPVAVASLLTASSLAPLAATGTDQFVMLAVMLALMVGVVQLALGVFRLGVIVNFLSHPVIVGFTNAAAMIIGLSQVNKLIGVPMGRSEHFIEDIWGVARQVGDTHWPTLAMGVAAIAIIWSIRRYAPKLPGVLVAVVLTTLVSYLISFEHKTTGSPDEIDDRTVQGSVERYMLTDGQIAALNKIIAIKANELRQAESDHEERKSVNLSHQIDLFHIELAGAEKQNRERMNRLRHINFVRTKAPENEKAMLYVAGHAPDGIETDGRQWHISKIEKESLRLMGGGEVLGGIPAGLPAFSVPKFSWSMISSLLGAAVIISLVGFMEAISVAKAIAAKTKQKIDPNQELIGQGLANIVGSFTQSFPVSGSFSRSAVNFNAGALTGMSSVFTGLFVLLTLLFLTPLLYHLPQAVLAGVIIMAVIGLINFGAVKHAWQANRHDGIASIATFVATLAFAPHLDKGIMIGAGLAIMLYLYRTMTPRVAILGRYHDGTLRDAKVNNLPASDVVTAVRFDGRLYFANISYFEEAILDAVANNPDAPYVLIVGDAINEIDASGEEVIRHLVESLNSIGVVMLFAGLKKQVLDVLQATGLREEIGEQRFFSTAEQALERIYSRAEHSDEDDALKPAAIAAA